VLSGGEKSRVALAKTLISESNFLLLDEPTNHLDMLSVQILIQALDQFQGTFVLVSHDRHFISQVANKIWYIEGQQLKSYPGTYQEYEYWRSQQNQAPTNNQPKPVSTKKKRIKRDQGDKQWKKLQKDLKQTEELIEKMEIQKQKLLGQLSNPEITSHSNALNEASEAFQANESALEKLHSDWEQLVLKLDSLEANRS